MTMLVWVILATLFCTGGCAEELWGVWAPPLWVDAAGSFVSHQDQPAQSPAAHFGSVTAPKGPANV
jgi:hypothetical protein